MDKNIEIQLLGNGINLDKVNQIEIEDLPQEIFDMVCDDVQPKQCFRNCFDIVSNMLRHDGYYLRYCLGYVEVHGVLLEHAWLNCGDVYYDPTFYVHCTVKNKPTYYQVIEFDLSEFLYVCDKTEYPPMLEYMARKLAGKYHEYICLQRQKDFWEQRKLES